MQQTKTIKSRITLEEFDSLHEIVDRTRSSTIEISVPRASLNGLISDNAEMFFLLPTEAHVMRSPTKGLCNPEGTPTAVHEAVAGQKRKNSKKIVIDKKLVLQMLIDHTILICKLENEGHEIE